jgi:hypothetical protein
MAEVKNFRDYSRNFRDPDAPDEETGASFSREPSYQEKIRNHRLIVFYRTIFLLIAAVAIVAFIYVNWHNKVYSESRVLSSTSLTGMSGVTVLPLGQNIIRYSKDGINCMSADGRALWNMTYDMQAPVVRICGETVAVGDYNGNTIYVANSQGTLGSFGTNLPIRDFCVSSQGVVAVILDDDDITRIKLFDTSGKELAAIKATMANSGYPTSMSLSPNAELLAVCYLKESGGSILTGVTFFNFGAVGQNETDNMVSSFKYEDTIIPYDVFLDSSTNMAVSDKSIVFYKGEDVPNDPVVNEIGETEIMSVYNNEDYAGIICAGTAEEGAYKLTVYNTSGKNILEKYFDLDYTDMFFSDDQFVVYNDKHWQLYGIDGTLRFEGEFDESIKAIIPGPSRNRFTIVTADSIDQIELR